MTKNVHYFVSERGDLLPRWREAFPSAQGFKFGELAGKSDVAKLVWVRLASGVAPAKTFEVVRQHLGDVSIIALGDQPGDEEALACFSAGARGYCNSHAVPKLLRNVADVALQGGLWIGESLMLRLLQGTARIAVPAPQGAAPEWAALLTERERQVTLAVAEGDSNKEIARRLGITERTVKAHATAIFGKLNVRDRLQLSLIVHGRKMH
jgi:two-component system, NarL family, nitrate/nitrite response regulator NarL